MLYKSLLLKKYLINHLLIMKNVKILKLMIIFQNQVFIIYIVKIKYIN